jgi:hypothetical protein
MAAKRVPFPPARIARCPAIETVRPSKFDAIPLIPDQANGTTAKFVEPPRRTPKARVKGYAHPGAYLSSAGIGIEQNPNCRTHGRRRAPSSGDR